MLYSTAFENFISGDDKWVDTEGWIGNSKGYGVHGIDQDVIAGGGLGKTAFLGFNQPGATLVVVAKPINYSPQVGDLPLVRVETLVGRRVYRRNSAGRRAPAIQRGHWRKTASP